jgi:hypothetical protein
MKRLLFIMAFSFTAGTLVRIKRHGYESYISTKREGGRNSIVIENVRSRRSKRRRQELLFEIKDGTTDISQGELKLCKHPRTSDIIACDVNDSLFTKWDFISDSGSVKIRTDNNICLEYSRNPKTLRERLSGQPCASRAEQLFDIEFQKEDDKDKERDRSNFDQPLENLVPYLLNAPFRGEYPAKQKIILYDGKKKPIASFVGPVRAVHPGDDKSLSHYYHPEVGG